MPPHRLDPPRAPSKPSAPDPHVLVTS
jgi:hypothetical protein